MKRVRTEDLENIIQDAYIDWQQIYGHTVFVTGAGDNIEETKKLPVRASDHPFVSVLEV